MNGSRCEMWFSTRMNPPDTGMFSPPSHVRLVVSSSSGFTMATPMVHAHPRLCCSLRTVTDAGYSDTVPLPWSGLTGSWPMSAHRPDHRFVVLVPVKPPAVGKSRLLGLDAAVRRSLAEAFAQDTVAACLAAG